MNRAVPPWLGRRTALAGLTPRPCPRDDGPAPSDAARRRRRQHADRLRALRRRPARRALAGRDRGAADGDELAALIGRLLELARSRLETLGRLPLLDRARARPRVRGVRRALPATRRSSSSGRASNRHPDPVRQPARGRARPDRELRRRERALRRAVHRRRLRHLDELRRRSPPRASTSAACSRRGSRSRWRRSSSGPRAWSRSTSSSRRAVIGKTTVGGAPVRARLRLRGPGRRHRDAHARRARRGRPGDRDRRPRRPDRPALRDDRARRPDLTLEGLRLVWELNR